MANKEMQKLIEKWKVKIQSIEGDDEKRDYMSEQITSLLIERDDIATVATAIPTDWEYPEHVFGDHPTLKTVLHAWLWKQVFGAN